MADDSWLLGLAVAAGLLLSGAFEPLAWAYVMPLALAGFLLAVDLGGTPGLVTRFEPSLGSPCTQPGTHISV